MDILLTVALPIFAVIFAGYGAGRWHLLSPAGIEGINAFVFALALPALLFDRLSSTPVDRLLDGTFIVAYVIVSVLVFAAAFALAHRGLHASFGHAARQAMSATYGNTGYMGLPIAQAAAGRAAAIPMAVCMALDMCFLMPLTMVLVSIGQGNRLPVRGAARTALRGLFLNPLVLGILLGAAVSALGVAMPVPVRAFAALLGNAAGPCALFTVGATLAGPAGAADVPVVQTGDGRGVALISVFKLVVHPLVMWGVMGGLFSVDPLWTATAILAASLPVTSTAYALSARYRTYLPQVPAAIRVTTLGSVVTVSAVLMILFGGA